MPRAYVLVNCNLGSEEAVITELKSMQGVRNVNGVFGAYDIIVDVQTPTIEKIHETISMKIRKLEGVRTTLTLMSIEY